MSVEGDERNSRAPAERNVECYLKELRLMMEGQNRSINRTHGSTLVIFARLWIYTPRSGM